MGYCRFQNTVADLRECLDAIRNEEDLSPEESKAKDRMLRICADILEASGFVISDDDYPEGDL